MKIENWPKGHPQHGMDVNIRASFVPDLASRATFQTGAVINYSVMHTDKPGIWIGDHRIDETKP